MKSTLIKAKFKVIAVALMAAALAVVTAPASQVQAESSWADGTHKRNLAVWSLEGDRATEEFSAYVGSGEKFRIHFAADFVSGTEGTVKVTVKGAEEHTCNVTRTEPCDWTSGAASQAGIWTVTVALQDGYTGGNHRVDWGLDVLLPTDQAINGRLWAEQYYMYQDTTADVSFYYVRNDGYMYKADYKNYNGLGSLFYADASGVTKNGQCGAAYRSAYLNSTRYENWQKEDTGYSIANESCGGRFKQFFSAPAADLPATARSFATGGTDWIKPQLRETTIGQLVFTSSNLVAAPYKGQLDFDIADYHGTASVEITRGGKTLRTIPLFVGNRDTFTVDFDGKDNSGQIIQPTNEALEATVVADHIGEAHFVSTDVELRGGGINVTRLTGSNANLTALSWNDTFLARDRCSTTSPLSANMVDSATGVHAWSIVKADNSPCDSMGNINNKLDGLEATDGSWGDVRLIDDWTWDVGARVVSLKTPLHPTKLPGAPNTGVAASWHNPLAMGAGVAGFVLVVGFLLRRRRALS